MRLPLIRLLILMAVLAGGPALADEAADPNLVAGEKAWNEYRTFDALRSLLPLAVQGNARAQFIVGEIHKSGFSDWCLATLWYDKAARQGDVSAQRALTYSYARGTGVVHDFRKAYMWALAADKGGDYLYRFETEFLAKLLSDDDRQEIESRMENWKAEEEPPADLMLFPDYLLVMSHPGKTMAEFGFGTCAGRKILYDNLKSLDRPRPSTYEEGKKAYDEGDYARAIEIIVPLAVAGMPEAQHLFGMMLTLGTGLNQNSCRSTLWFDKAARQGHARAQSWLALRYTLGTGVRPNPRKAYLWRLAAVEGGYSSAGDELAEFEIKLTSEEISEIKSKMANWRAEDEPPADIMFIYDAVESLLAPPNELKPFGLRKCHL